MKDPSVTYGFHEDSWRPGERRNIKNAINVFISININIIYTGIILIMNINSIVIFGCWGVISSLVCSICDQLQMTFCPALL